MLLDLISILVCFYLATRLRRSLGEEEKQPSPWLKAKQSMRWGAVVVTIPLLSYFGLIKYIHDGGFPSPFILVMCTGVTALLLMGTPIEFSGNVLIDTLIISLALVAICFTIVTGVPETLARANGGNLCLWFLLCIGAAIMVRAILWTQEE